MAVKGPGRRIDASNTPFNRMQHNAAQGKTTHNRRAMVQARGKPGQHASAEGVPAPAQELARAARQAGEPKRRVQGKQEGAGGEPAAVGTRERKQEGGQPSAAHTLTSGVARRGGGRAGRAAGGGAAGAARGRAAGDSAAAVRGGEGGGRWPCRFTLGGRAVSPLARKPPSDRVVDAWL